MSPAGATGNRVNRNSHANCREMAAGNRRTARGVRPAVEKQLIFLAIVRRQPGFAAPTCLAGGGRTGALAQGDLLIAAAECQGRCNNIIQFRTCYRPAPSLGVAP